MIELNIDHSVNVRCNIGIRTGLKNKIYVIIRVYDEKNFRTAWCNRSYFSDGRLHWQSHIIEDSTLESKIDNLIDKYFKLQAFT